MKEARIVTQARMRQLQEPEARGLTQVSLAALVCPHPRLVVYFYFYFMKINSLMSLEAK